MSPRPPTAPADIGSPVHLTTSHVLPATVATAGITNAPLTLSAPADPSPAALLAASLVRSRATYFEQLSSGFSRASSGSRASAYGAACNPQKEGGAQVAAELDCSPTPRAHTALAAHPLHPLAPHPLCVMGRPCGGAAAVAGAAASSNCLGDDRHHHRQRQRQAPTQQDSDSGQDESTDKSGYSNHGDDSVCTFFDKPSYTCYGAAVEMSQTSSYGGSAGPHSSSSSAQAPAAAVVAATDVHDSSGPTHGGGPNCSSSNESVIGCGGPGYVRSMSEHFARFSSGSIPGICAGVSSGGRVVATAPDVLFGDLVAHVGALLASHPDIEAQMGMVQGLSDRLLQLHALCETLGRKENEVEHLRGVLCELSTTRAEAIRLKVQMAESLNGLQQEYYKVLRSAQLAQNSCKQHSARAASTRKQLVETQGDLMRYKRAVVSLRDRSRQLCAENEEMAARLAALEGARGPGIEASMRSASYLALLQAQAPILY